MNNEFESVIERLLKCFKKQKTNMQNDFGTRKAKFTIDIGSVATFNLVAIQRGKWCSITHRV
jgi:hypothetical protein